MENPILLGFLNLSQNLSSWSSRLRKYKAFVRLYLDCGDTNYDETFNASLLQKSQLVKCNVTEPWQV